MPFREEEGQPHCHGMMPSRDRHPRAAQPRGNPEQAVTALDCFAPLAMTQKGVDPKSSESTACGDSGFGTALPIRHPELGSESMVCPRLNDGAKGKVRPWMLKQVQHDEGFGGTPKPESPQDRV